MGKVVYTVRNAIRIFLISTAIAATFVCPVGCQGMDQGTFQGGRKRGAIRFPAIFSRRDAQAKCLFSIPSHSINSHGGCSRFFLFYVKVVFEDSRVLIRAKSLLAVLDV